MLTYSNTNNSFTTVRDLIRFAVTKFKQNNIFCGHGTDNVYDEAVYLVLSSLSLPVEQLEPYFDAKILPEEIDFILSNIYKRSVEKIPAAYLTHVAYLQGFEFYIDERVIVPRSYIAELLLGQVLDKYIEYPELIHNALDLCTGNGSLAIIMASYFPEANITASDISSDALNVAQINVSRHKFDKQIELVKSDLFVGLDSKLKYDLIVTNPPYVADRLRLDIPKEYNHEPEIALYADNDGLYLIQQILEQASSHLTEFGVVVVEMGDNLDDLYNTYPYFPFEFIPTTSGDGYVFVATYQQLVAYFTDIEG